MLGFITIVSLPPEWHSDSGRAVRSGRASGGLLQSRTKWRDEGSSSAWNFNFNNGKRNSNHLDNSNHPRALCVRRSGP